LGIKYREVLPDGRAYGGPPYYIKKGLGEERGWPAWAWKTLAFLFTITFCSTAIVSMANYTIMEGAMTCFNLTKEQAIIVGFIYALLVALICIGFIPRVARVAEFLIPLMVIIYIGGGLGVIIANYDKIPRAIADIFTYAFTPLAPIGGFAGATIAKAIQVGVARAVYSNEAGWGSAPHIHATAKVEYPMQQAIWGAMEVFVDTIIVCTITALIVTTTRVWETGYGGVTAVLTAFRSVYGPIAPIILYITLFYICTNYKYRMVYILRGRSQVLA